MTQEEKNFFEDKISWWLDHIQDLAARMGIENISILISSNSVFVRIYADDFEELIGEMSKYNGEDDELKEFYQNEWRTEWRDER